MRKRAIYSAIIILIVSYIPILAYAQIAQNKYKDLSILVSSCDKYQQFWEPFFNSLEQNWPELMIKQQGPKIYLIANNKKSPHRLVETLNIQNEISWSDNMLYALEQINTKYVLLFLDDYWLDAKVNEPRLEQILDVMRTKDIAYVQLYVDSQEKNLSRAMPNIPGLAYKNKFQKYRASLQLAIWETNALKQILRSGESAWDFEMAASIRSSGYPKEFLTVQADAPISYLNASHLGHIRPDALAFAKAQNPNYINEFPVLQLTYNWGLKAKHYKHRLNTLIALIKRNIGSNDSETYRYSYEKRD